MATITKGNYISAEASVDLSTKQYYIVTLDANRKAALATGATDEIVGVLDEVPQKATGVCSIAHISGNGIGKVKAGASFSKGAYLTSDGSGLAIAATQTSAGSQPTKRVFGRALEAANASSDVVEYE